MSVKRRDVSDAFCVLPESTAANPTTQAAAQTHFHAIAERDISVQPVPEQAAGSIQGPAASDISSRSHDGTGHWDNVRTPDTDTVTLRGTEAGRRSVNTLYWHRGL